MMTVFIYDSTFEGLLTAVFEAYSTKQFPDVLVKEGDILPLFQDYCITVITETGKAQRVWKGLQKKISKSALMSIPLCWMADTYPKVDELLFRYICKAIDASRSIEINFGDPDVLAFSKIYRQVRHEQLRLLQFARFQKAYDGTYFCAFEPMYNILPLAIDHFQDRFRDQKFLLYDLKREYGYYYDLEVVREITFCQKEQHLITGFLNESLMDEEELLFQNLWKTYFKSIAIKERINPRKQRQDMPVRYWKHLTEKQ